ncbi:hypothetical protein ACIOC2_20285 [Streptomyces sp. NPDC088337]|uniref:hypothetical protein n=1 Tax=unclassified Streptomyces TaxID=2593676 RepID=UPI0033C588DB
MARKHSTTVTHKPPRSPKIGAYTVTCWCSWVSYGHDTRGTAEAHGKQHETARNR